MREERMLRTGRELFLAAFGLPLGDVDPWVTDRLTSMLEERDFHAGETLVSASEPIESLLFMMDGEVRFTRNGRPSWTTRGRWVIGIFDVLADRPATYAATALRDFRGLQLPAAAWIELLEDSAQLSRQLVANASRTVAHLEARVPEEGPLASAAPPPPSPPPGDLALVERLALLLDVRMLRLAGVQALADLAAVSRRVSFAAGETVFERGTESEHLIRIVEGEVLAQRTAPEVVRRFGPADLVCPAAILGGVAGPWRAHAIVPTSGLAFPIEVLLDLMEEHFDLVRSTMAALGARRNLLLEYLAAKTDPLVLT
jgi:CRP-like cAMP-binding protein